MSNELISTNSQRQLHRQLTKLNSDYLSNCCNYFNLRRYPITGLPMHLRKANYPLITHICNEPFVNRQPNEWPNGWENCLENCKKKRALLFVILAYWRSERLSIIWRWLTAGRRETHKKLPFFSPCRASNFDFKHEADQLIWRLPLGVMRVRNQGHDSS